MKPYKPKGLEMGLTHISVTLKNLTTNDSYQANFLVDTGAIDSLAPASDLRKIGIAPVGKRAYELADGSIQELEFGFAEFEFMNDRTVGRVIFGSEGVEPLLGVTVLESVGISVDPSTQSLKRLPSIYLK
jgi:clan AA aspartic protease